MLRRVVRSPATPTGHNAAAGAGVVGGAAAGEGGEGGGGASMGLLPAPEDLSDLSGLSSSSSSSSDDSNSGSDSDGDRERSSKKKRKRSHKDGKEGKKSKSKKSKHSSKKVRAACVCAPGVLPAQRWSCAPHNTRRPSAAAAACLPCRVKGAARRARRAGKSDNARPSSQQAKRVGLAHVHDVWGRMGGGRLALSLCDDLKR